jgi:hypothetical protein
VDSAGAHGNGFGIWFLAWILLRRAIEFWIACRCACVLVFFDMRDDTALYRAAMMRNSLIHTRVLDLIPFLSDLQHMVLVHIRGAFQPVSVRGNQQVAVGDSSLGSAYTRSYCRSLVTSLHLIGLMNKAGLPRSICQDTTKPIPR